MMKIFRSRSIALLLVVSMIFTFSFTSVIASTHDNGEEKALKVDNYDSDITDSYHPKALIEWLENEYDIIITDYYIKAGSESSSGPQGPGGFFDSEGDNINDKLVELGLDYYTSNNEAFNQNYEFTVEYSDITLGSVPDGGTEIPYGISHVLFLYTEVPETGSITIEKVLLDVDDEAITEDGTEFTVNVEGNGYKENHTFSVNEPVVIEDLLLGDYTISEVDIPDGFELISIVEDEVTLSENGQEVTVVVTNQVEEEEVVGDPGALIIEKVLWDADEEVIDDDDTTFMVNIQGDDYDEDHEFSVNEPLVLDDLEPGDYYIEELETPEGFVFVSISHEMVTISEDNEEDITVTVTNMVEEEILGSLSIEKVLLDVDEEEITDDTTEFTVNIKGPEGYDEDHTFTVNEPVVIEELLLGKYMISEKDIPEGYEFISIEIEEEMIKLSESYNPEKIEVIRPEIDYVLLSEIRQHATVIVTNMMEEDEVVGEPGALIVEKVLWDADEEVIDDDDTTFMVNIQGDEYDKDHEFSVNEPLVLDTLDPGDYTITEIDVPEDFEFVSISDGMVTISADNQEDITVTVTNMVKEEIDDIVGEPGALIVEKVLWDADEEVIDNDDTTFMVNIQGDEYDEDHEFSVNEPLVLDTLDPGDYTITEVDIPDGFEFVSISEGMITISEDNGEDVTVTITNMMEEDIIEIIDDEEIPEGTPEEEIILDEEVPLGDGELPRTGQRHPGFFYILGLMITGLGVVSKRFLSKSLNTTL